MFLKVDTRFYVAGIHLDTDKKFKFQALYLDINIYQLYPQTFDVILHTLATSRWVSFMHIRSKFSDYHSGSHNKYSCSIIMLYSTKKKSKITNCSRMRRLYKL